MEMNIGSQRNSDSVEKSDHYTQGINAKCFRVISFNDKSLSKEYRYQKLLYQAFVNEMREMVSPLELSFDVNRFGSSFCETCDPRVSPFINRPLGNDALLERQLRFEPVVDPESGVVSHGFWTIYRFYRAGWKFFPRCEDISRSAANKLVLKLASLGKNGQFHSAKEVTFKVQTSFLKSRVRWANEDDLKGEVTYLPQLAHANAGSLSSKLRLCIVPNRSVFVNKELGFRTYNSFIRKNSLQLPSFLRFSLASALSIESIYLDISDAFGCLKNSLADSKHSIVFCLKSKNNLPSYDLSQCPDGLLHPLVQTSSSFGQADVSRLSQNALSNMVSVYRKHCVNKEVEDDILSDIQRVLTSFSYCDDSQIPAQSHRVIEWCQRRGRPPPRPVCSCTNDCKSWSCNTLYVTNADLLAHEAFMQREAKNYLRCIAHAFVKVANFSSHEVKFVKATNPCMQAMLDEIGVTDNQSPRLSESMYDVKRPTPVQVQTEIERGTNVGNCGDGLVDEVIDEAASQLGKTYVGNQVYLKTQKLYVCHFVGKSKRSTPSFDNYLELRAFCDGKNVKISKISLSSVCGQMWDPAGLHLGVARSHIKETTRIYLLDGPKSWHEPVCDRVFKLFWKSIEAYYLTCRLPQPRSNLLLFPAARFALIAGSDGGENLQSYVLSLLSYVTIDKKHVAKAKHLNMNSFTNHKNLTQCMPIVELVSFHKMLLSVSQALADLKSFGIVIPPSACIITTDSLTVLIQIRTLAHMYKKKVASMISRCQLLMAQHNICPFDVVWIDQKSLPLGARYHADILSKTRQDKATPESIIKDHQDLCSMSWIEAYHPSEWKWCHRDAGIPRLSDRELLHDLGVDEDHLQQVKDFLDKPTITSLAAFTAVAESVTTPLQQVLSSPRVTHNGGHHHGDDDGDAEHDSHVIIGHNDHGRGCDDNVTKGNAPESEDHCADGANDSHHHGDDDGDAEHDSHVTIGRDDHGRGSDDNVTRGNAPESEDHCADHHQGDENGDNHDGHDGYDDYGDHNNPSGDHDNPSSDSSSVIALDDGWLLQMDNLVARKHLFGLGTKSVVSIMALVFQFIFKLKRKLIRANNETCSEHHNWPRSLKPWCNDLMCGLHPGVGCKSPHPRLYDHSYLESPYEPETHSRKWDSHFLFQKQSLVGYNLGCPATLVQIENQWRSLDKSVVMISTQASRIPNPTFSELRVAAFDYLCFINSGKFHIRGFETISSKSIWGARPIALGRKQRDWVRREDSIPRLRLLNSATAFASLCLSTSHAVSMGESPELAKLYLVGLRVAIEYDTKLLKAIQLSCYACNLSRARHQRNDTKMKSHHLGPSGRITALGSYPPGLTCSEVDLLGPIVFLDHMANRVKLYLLICVSHSWGVTKLLPIRSKSTESIMLGLKTIAYQSSTRFELVAHDDGGEWHHTGNTFAPMREAPDNPLVEKWFDVFRREADQLELQGLGIFVRFGKSRNCAAVERRVNDVKHVFKDFHLFAKDSEPTDIHEILFLCALTEHIIHSRPVLIYGNQVYSLNTLRSLLVETGLLATEADGIEPISSGGQMKSKVEKICARLSQLRTQMTRLMISFHLDALLDNVHRRERVKHSRAVEALKIGDIVFDSVGFQKTGHVTGSLARVIGQSTSLNHLLISKAALKSKGKLFKQICVSRPANELHYVCQGSSEPVAIGELDTFNLLQYLPAADPLATTWTLPTHSDSCIPTVKEIRSKNLTGSPHIPEQTISESVRPPVATTRSGRIESEIKSEHLAGSPQIPEQTNCESVWPPATTTRSGRVESEIRSENLTGSPQIPEQTIGESVRSPAITTRSGRVVKTPLRFRL